MVTVYTKEELAKAIENKTPIILCKGDVANEIAKEFLDKRKKNSLGILAGIAMIVFEIESLYNNVKKICGIQVEEVK